MVYLRRVGSFRQIISSVLTMSELMETALEAPATEKHWLRLVELGV
jgi:hypothetical protein